MDSLKALFVTLFIMASLGIASAQIDAPYLEDNLIGTTIILKPKGEILLPNKQQASVIHEAASHNYYIRHTFNLSYCKPKRLSKQTVLKLGGFCKTQKDIDYDTYMVLYKDVLYFVRPEDVVDNTILDEKNKGIRLWYERLLNELDSLRGEYDALYIAKLNEVQSGKRALETKESNIAEVAQELFEQRLSEQLAPMLEAYHAWYDGLEPSVKQAADLISIQRARLASPNSAGGCDFGLEFTNMSEKTIKYLDWYGNVYNAVNDKVACSIRNTYSFSGRVTGPLEYKQQYGGNWDCIIYNYSAKELRFTKVIITYMDGSKKTLSGTSLNGLIGAPACSIHGWEVDYIKRNANEDAGSQIKREKRLWEERETCLGAIDQRKDPPSNDLPFFDKLFSLKKEVAAKEDEIAKFEDRNFIVK